MDDNVVPHSGGVDFQRAGTAQSNFELGISNPPGCDRRHTIRGDHLTGRDDSMAIRQEHVRDLAEIHMSYVAGFGAAVLGDFECGFAAYIAVVLE